MKFLRKIFGRKKKVNRKHITNYRYVGSERQVYNNQTNEWVWWYMLIIIDSDGGEIECNEHNSHLAYQISMNENLGDNSTQGVSEKNSSAWESSCYSGSSGYSGSDSIYSSSDSGSSSSSSFD